MIYKYLLSAVAAAAIAVPCYSATRFQAMLAAEEKWDIADLKSLTAIDAPAGTVTECQYTAMGYSDGDYFEDTRLATSVIITDTDVYVKNPLWDYYTGAWMHGTIQGDKVVFQFPQAMGKYLRQDLYTNTFEYDDVYFFRCAAEEVIIPIDGGDDLSYWTMSIDQQSQTIEATIGADGSISWGDSDAEYMSDLWGIGAYYLSDGELYWDKSADMHERFTPLGIANELPPASAVIEQWAYRDRYQYHMVNVAIEGSSMWIQGADPLTTKLSGVPAGWLKGEISGDKVTFATGQYMGLDDYYRRTIYFLAGGPKQIPSDYTPEGYEIISAPLEDVSLPYDAAKKTLGEPSGNQQFLFVTQHLTPADLSEDDELLYYYLVGQVNSPEFYAFDMQSAQRPANPVISSYDTRTYTGWGGAMVTEVELLFATPNIDVNGAPLPADRCHYNIYVNDALFALWNDEFLKLPVSLDGLTDIPYLLHEDYSLFTNSLLHDLYISATGIDTIGLQGFYTDENGKRYATDLVTIDLNTGKIVETDSLEEIEAAEPVMVNYYDLQGHPVANPAHGLYVKHTILSNGNVKSEKILVR